MFNPIIFWFLGDRERSKYFSLTGAIVVGLRRLLLQLGSIGSDHDDIQYVGDRVSGDIDCYST